MLYQDPRIDPTRLPVEGIGCLFGQAAGKNTSSDHRINAEPLWFGSPEPL